MLCPQAPRSTSQTPFHCLAPQTGITDMATNSNLTRILRWVIVIQVFAITEATGQQINEDTPAWRARCSAAVSALEQRQSRPEVIESLRTLINCERSAGEAHSRVWSTPALTTDELKALAYASRSVRDRRIMDAVMSKASDAAASSDVRLAALTVLASYIDPSIVELREASTWDYPEQRSMIYQSAHARQVRGTVPLGQGYVATIMDRFAEIAGADPDERLAAAAEFLRKTLESVGAG
jgi:hypothetical protein